LYSVKREEDSADPKNSHWAVLWAPESGTLDDLLLVRVYDDGRITYQGPPWA
jgi:hypothetical protein